MFPTEKGKHAGISRLADARGLSLLLISYISSPSSHAYPAAGAAYMPQFEVKYSTMVANVVHYINSVSAFKGKVIFVTSPSGVKGCESAFGPVTAISSGGSGGGAANMMSTPSSAAREETLTSKRAYWFESNPQGIILPPDSTGAFHPFGRQRSAERLWEHQFQKHAPRLKAATLNISSMSDGRADVLVREPAAECAAFCFPGLPHAWAEVMLRMVEQLIWGATDSLPH